MKLIADRVAALAPEERRRFLKLLGVVFAAPLVPSAARFAANALAVNEAYAQDQETATLFLEFDFRDQVDLMHVMVPPSIATHPQRLVGTSGELLAMFAPQSELQAHPNNVFLTNDSSELAPHIDSVAMLDTCVPTIGSVHGHEGGNGVRSPGRLMDGGKSGKLEMFKIDAPVSAKNGAGSEQLYSLSATPASFHNYYQRAIGARVSNGFAFKGISRTKHSVYHYGAGLPDAELTRVATKQELLRTFDGMAAPPPQLALLAEIRGRVGLPYRLDQGVGRDALARRLAALHGNALLRLELSEEERARWSAGVPPQQCTVDDVRPVPCRPMPQDELELLPYHENITKAEIWEQFAYVSKLFRAGLVQTAALEFDFMDVTGDGSRTESVLRTQAQQVARPLARLISDLKAAGLYERTLIAVYTLDGSRRPAANSYGDDGKNTVILAGGRVRGGYYGDIVITRNLQQGGHEYALRAPDPETGVLGPLVTNWRDRKARVPDGSVWRTVALAMGIPEAEYVGRFDPEIDAAKSMRWMLRS